MPALIAARCNEPAFKQLYERVFDKSKIKMKGYVAVHKKLLIVIYTLWKNDAKYNRNQEEKYTSGNDESTLLFPYLLQNEIKKVVLQQGSTTQDEHRYNKVPNALFPYQQS